MESNTQKEIILFIIHYLREVKKNVCPTFICDLGKTHKKGGCFNGRTSKQKLCVSFAKDKSQYSLASFIPLPPIKRTYH